MKQAAREGFGVVYCISPVAGCVVARVSQPKRFAIPVRSVPGDGASSGYTLIGNRHLSIARSQQNREGRRAHLRRA